MSKAEFPGQLLEERRQTRGYSLMDVHRHIRVPFEHLQALERGDLDRLPERTYVTGYLNSYCEFLELDAEPFLDRYHSRAGQRAGSVTQQTAARPRPRPRWLSEAVAWGSICALLLLGWFAYTIVIRPWAEEAQRPAEAGAFEVTPPAHFETDF